MQTSFEVLFLVPLAIQLLFILGLAIWYRTRTPRPPRRIALIFRCNRCLKIYLDQRRIPLSRCPDCSFLNEPIKR